MLHEKHCVNGKYMLFARIMLYFISFCVITEPIFFSQFCVQFKCCLRCQWPVSETVGVKLSRALDTFLLPRKECWQLQASFTNYKRAWLFFFHESRGTSATYLARNVPCDKGEAAGCLNNLPLFEHSPHSWVFLGVGLTFRWKVLLVVDHFTSIMLRGICLLDFG